MTAQQNVQSNCEGSWKVYNANWPLKKAVIISAKCMRVSMYLNFRVFVWAATQQDSGKKKINSERKKKKMYSLAWIIALKTSIISNKIVVLANLTWFASWFLCPVCLFIGWNVSSKDKNSSHSKIFWTHWKYLHSFRGKSLWCLWRKKV